MGYLLIFLIVIYTIISMVLVTFLIHYGNLAWQCDSLIGFYCHTDWQCANPDGSLDGAGIYNALGDLITPDKMSCHLKGLYGVDPGPDCNNYPKREPNYCIIDPDTNPVTVSPNLFACDKDSPNYNPATGLCKGLYSNSQNIPQLPNNSNIAGSISPQYGMGNKIEGSSPFDCACYFGNAVMASSGTQGGNNLFSNGQAGGGIYNIGAIACSRVLDAYAPT